MPTTPETPSERYALIGWYMAFGLALSTKEISEMLNLSHDSALRAMYRVSRILPIYQDDKGIWRQCTP